MTGDQLHQYRCETCRFYKVDEYTGMSCILKDDLYGLTQWYVKLIERVGCASHSSVTAVPDSTTLIRMAETDWHNREERRGIHEMAAWTAGWITGYMTPTKPDWDAVIRKKEVQK